MPKSGIEVALLASTVVLVACEADRENEQRVWEDETGRVTLVELSPEVQNALRIAPSTNLVGIVPRELREAIDSNAVERIKIQLVEDKVHGEVVEEFPPTYQGWIYYEPTRLQDGGPFAPAVLCVSQSDPISWNHCQDESDLATRRLVKKMRQSD